MRRQFTSFHRESIVDKTAISPVKLLRRRQQTASSLSEQDCTRRRFGAIMMATVGILLLVHRRANYDSLVAIVVESFVIMACLLCACSIQRWQKRLAVKMREESAMSGAIGRINIYRILADIITGIALLAPWISNSVVRLNGTGNGMEIVMLTSLAWGALALACRGTKSRTISLSVICSGFLTLFATFIADNRSAVWLTLIWAVVCMWWLVDNYWSRMETTSAINYQPARFHRFFYVCLGLGALAFGFVLVSNRIPILQEIPIELMPTSGGTSDSDPGAERGIGNGDALVAAKNHATAFGPVDTNLFLESPKPSLFDIQSDEFGKPRNKSQLHRSQALNPQDVTSDAGKFSESNRTAGGDSNEFSVQRQRPQRRQSSTDLVGNSLMFWQGEDGAHLAVQRYDHFDGESWTRRQPIPTVSPTGIESVPVDDQVWFRSDRRVLPASHNPFVGAVPEAIKFTRYNSPIIPTRSGMQLWSVDQLTQQDFFEISTDDCLHMADNQQIPEYTVIKMINSSMDVERIEELTRGCAPGRSHRLQSSSCASAVNMLAHQLVGNLPRGWQQVQAIVTGLRNHFLLEYRDGDIPTVSSESALDSFLSQRRGPDYLFATAASLMLDHLGYRTRFVVGFYANPQNYLTRERHIAIQPSDIHAWLEIDVGHEFWIPLEPSPGYLQPRYTGSWLYHLNRQKQAIAVSLGSLAFIGVGLYLLRRVLADLISRILWPIAYLVGDRRSISWLSRLIDLRCRMAGAPRSPGVLPKAHVYRLADYLPQSLQEPLRTFYTAADEVCFGNKSTLSADERSALVAVWSSLTIRLLRRGVRNISHEIRG